MSTVGRRDFLRLMGVGLVGVAAVACGEAPAPTPAPAKETPKPAAATTAPTAAPTKPASATAAPAATSAPAATTAPAAQPAAGQTVATTSAGPVNVGMPTKFRERPDFAKLVADGKLPPIEKRLPTNPQVVKTAEVGKYGGTMNLATFPFSHTQEPYAFIVNNEVTTFSPEYAEGYEVSKDYQTYTMKLRKGTKWSTGEPFSSEDFIFHWEDVEQNKELFPAGPRAEHVVAGKPMEVKAVDETTVQFKFAAAYRPFISMMASYNSRQSYIFNPKHYLKKWHVKYNPDAPALAKQEGFETWAKAFLYHVEDSYLNGKKEGPILGPWIPTTWTSSTHTFEVNPYYFAVDVEGQQLPYMDRIISAEGLNDEIRVAQALAGQIHYLNAQKIADINIFKDNAQKGGYRMILMKNSVSSLPAIGFNQAHKDPVKRKLFQDLRWRQAISLSINRDEMNKVVHFGTGVPQQQTLSSSVSFYKPEWAKAYAEYSPDKANALLDEIGLKWDAQKKYRLGPDGKEFTLFFDRHELVSHCPAQAADLLREYFEKVGIKTVLNVLGANLYAERRNGNDLEFGAWESDRIEELRCFLPGITKWDPKSETAWGVPWGIWKDTQGKQGEEPPQKYKDQFDRLNRWYSSTTDEEYKKLGQEIWDFWANDLTVIGTVAFPQSPNLLSNKIGNGPVDGMWYGDGMNQQKTLLPQCWYFKS